MQSGCCYFFFFFLYLLLHCSELAAHLPARGAVLKVRFQNWLLLHPRGNLLEMQILEPHLRSAESQALGLGPKDLF